MRKHPLANCEECPLYERGRFVPSYRPSTPTNAGSVEEGGTVLRGSSLDDLEQPEVSEDEAAGADLRNKNGLLGIVGEAPGAQEVSRGIPFTGPSGKLLGLVLEHHGLKKDEAFLSNAVLCRPPGNETPSKEAIEACRPRLIQELKEVDARTVLVLGNSAARSILESRTGITQLRQGPGKSSSFLPGVRIIPTIHPAAALRHSDSFPDIVTDIGKIVNDPNLWVPVEYEVYEGQEAILALKELGSEYQGKPVAVDIEAGVEKDGSGAFEHPSRFKDLCVGFSYAPGRAVVINTRDGSPALSQQLRETMSDIKVVMHNGKFDLAGMYRHTKGDASLWFDTMLASYVLDERPGHHGLEVLSTEYLGAPSWKHDLDQYLGRGKTYAAIPSDVLHKYNAQDVGCTYQLYQYFEERLEVQKMRKQHDFLIDASNQLMYLELNGVGINLEYLYRLDEEYRQSLAELLQKIHDHTDVDLNPNSPKQVKAYLESVHVRVASTTKEQMQAIIEKAPEGHSSAEYARLHIRFKGESKQYGTYVKGIRGRLYGGRVYTTYLLHGSVTGRLASRNPNLQNITRDAEGRPSIRKMFVPTKPDTNVFVQSDYSQAELRVMAALSGDKFLHNVFAQGRSIHKEFSVQMFGAGYNHEQYIRIKAFVFGIAYGREAPSIAAEYGIPLSEALEMQQAFLDLIPELVEWRNDIKAQVRQNKFLETPFGRRRRFWLITKENQNAIMREALAFVPQSTASDICLGAAVELRQSLRGLAFLRLLVHDSILVECHRDNIDAVRSIMEEAMVRHGTQILPQVPWKVDTGVGDSWADV